MFANEEARKKVLHRLKRIEGQTQALTRLVESDAYCVDVLIQIAAVRGALDKVGHLLLSEHVHHCVNDACATGSAASRQKKLDELLDVFERFGR